jgi:hypothetical protein
MAENNAGREERPETGSEEEISSRDYSTDSEGTVGEVQGTEEERIALAIEGKDRSSARSEGWRTWRRDRSPAPRSHRAISGETERSAQRRNRQVVRKVPCQKKKRQRWRKAGRSHHGRTRE